MQLEYIFEQLVRIFNIFYAVSFTIEFLFEFADSFSRSNWPMSNWQWIGRQLQLGVMTICMTACWFKSVFTVKQKLEFSGPLLQSFNARGFNNRSKTWIRLRSNNVFCHFLFLKSEKLLEICDRLSKRKLTWKPSDLHVVAAVVGRPSSLERTLGGTFWNVFQWRQSINIFYSPIRQLVNRKKSIKILRSPIG